MKFGGRSLARLLAGGAVALLSAGFGVANAKTLCVNPSGTGGCFKTINGAVTAVKAGDTISVAAGTYVEGNIKIDKSLSLVGVGGADTIINAAGKANGIYVDGLDTKIPLSEVVLAGFTVKNSKF
jgi:hypothetical protein